MNLPKTLLRRALETIIPTGFAFYLVLTVIFSLSTATIYAEESHALFTKALNVGMADEQVKRLQEFLKQFPNIYPEGLVTGYFGLLTENAVKRFQMKEGVETIGIVGPKTRAKLNKLITDGTAGSAVAIDSASVPSTTPELLPHLKIPKINVDAPVEDVGLTSQGAMDIPKGPNGAVWFNLGPRPGEVGSAVIAGHYGWKNEIPAVFDNLHKLEKGDKIYIKDEKGITMTFVVRQLRTYGEDEDASLVFDSSDGGAHLNLVTCQGVWNKNKKSYSNRLVVFTDKEI